MDSSAADPLNDTPTLPELSFDDLLDESPVKTINDNLADPLDLNHERKTSWEDETLNTPGPKKPRTVMVTKKEEPIATKQQRTVKPATATTTNEMHTPTTPTRTTNTTTASSRDSLQWSSTTAKVATTIGASTNSTQIKINTTTTSTPTTTQTLLNSKNVLPKSTPTTNQLIKIAPKTNVSAVAAASTAIGNSKTALKTSNGQIYYLQKSTGGISALRLSAAPKLASATNAAANAAKNAATASAVAGNKTVAIQVLRSADGTLIPLKSTANSSTATTTTSKGGALTLSPNMAAQLSGKKIITNSGNKIVIKATPKTPTTTMTATTLNDNCKLQQSVTTTVSSASSTVSTTSNAGKLLVQSTNGKQIVVSNQQIVKLSPKPTTPTSTTAVAAAGGQMQTIQLTGKSGVQYLRVLPNSKITTSAAATNTTTTIAAGASQVTASTAATSTTATATTSSFKLLNSAPQKFTVVRTAAGTTKMVLSQTPKNFSPITSKVQKTIVTVPTFRKISDINSSPNINTSTAINQSSYVQSSSNSSGICKVSLVQKHKISEINAQLQSMTSGGGGDEPEIKKTATGGRIVVMSRSMLRTNNSGSMATSQQRTSVSVAGSISQLTTSGATTTNATSSSPKKLYSILKTDVTVATSDDDATAPPPPPHPVELKTNAELKSLIICGQAQALMAQQQQHKAQQMLQKQRLLHQQQQLQQQMQRQRQQRQQQQQQQQQQNENKAKQVQLMVKQQQLKQQFQQQQQLQQMSNKFMSSTNIAVKVKQEPHDPSDVNEENVGTVVRRKHCNCTKSQCLKLYCDCFANGEFCQDCNCKDCFNNLQYEDERQKAIRNCLERNPSAFKPKITTAQDQNDMRLHNKGCNCKRSGCLKNYCECYEAKIPCSSNCKCFGCRNIIDRPDLDMDPIDSKILATLANATGSGSAVGGGSGMLTAGQKRTYEKMDRNSKQLLKESNKALANVGSSNNEIGTSCGQAAAAAEKQQCNFITQEVIDATIQCMISQADECEKNGLPAYQTEKMVMEELGRCLVEIIDFSIRNTDTSYTQD